MADGILKVGQITNSAGSGNITIGSGVTLQTGTPTFQANATGITVANASWTELVLGTEDFDTHTSYDTSTGRFTVPTGRAGIYHFDFGFGISANPDDNEKVSVRLYKNGSAESLSVATAYNAGAGQTSSVKGSYMLDLADGDYVSAYGYHNEGSSTSDGTGNFSGFKIGA